MGRAFPRISWQASSNGSIASCPRLITAACGWACPSRARSSRRIGDRSGWTASRARAPASPSSCPDRATRQGRVGLGLPPRMSSGAGASQKTVRGRGAPADDEVHSSSERRESMSGKTILLAEDDQDIRDVVQEVLEERGYDVIPARTGRQALDVLALDRSARPGAGGGGGGGPGGAGGRGRGEGR